jgi:hypothetical protein
LLIDTVIIPEKATSIPTICIRERAIPVIAQVRTLTMTALKLITADTGPVGPLLSARMTKSSASANAAPDERPVFRVSYSMYNSKGTFIIPKADKTMTNIAHMKSPKKLSFRKV